MGAEAAGKNESLITRSRPRPQHPPPLSAKEGGGGKDGGKDGGGGGGEKGGDKSGKMLDPSPLERRLLDVDQKARSSATSPANQKGGGDSKDSKEAAKVAKAAE